MKDKIVLILLLIILVCFCYNIINIYDKLKTRENEIKTLQTEVNDIWESIYALDEQYIVLFHDVYNTDKE